MTQPVEVWRYQVGVNLSIDAVYGVAVTADNSAFLLGLKEDYLATSGSDFAAVKIDADGKFLWEWKEGSEGDDAWYSAAAVADGVVGSGYFNGTWNESTTEGGADFAAVKLYSNGTVAWRWHEGTDEGDFLLAAVQTVDGNVVVAGYTGGNWNDTTDGYNAVAAAKLNADDGEEIWRYQDGTTGNEGNFVLTAAARGDGSVVLGGSAFRFFETTSGEAYWGTNFFALALDKDGNELWRWEDGPGAGSSYVLGVAAFDDDSVLLAGKTNGDWEIDNLGEGDFSLAKLNASGYLEWFWQDGTEFDEEFAGAATGVDGSVILCGYTYGSWAPTQAGGDYYKDFVAMSINAEGDILWRYQAGTTLDDVFNDVAVRPDGSIVLGGWTNGNWTESDISDSYPDFAAVLLNTTTPTTSSAPFPTPSPAFSATSSPISLTTPSPTPSRTPSPVGTSPPIEPSTESDSEAPAGLIIGSSVGSVAIVAILIACCFCWWCGGKGYKTKPPPAPSTLPAGPIFVAATGQASSIAGANGNANAPPPAYTDPPPAYSSVA